MKKVLSFSSHTLSDYAKCPKSFEYRTLMQLEPKHDKPAFTRGSLIGRCLEIYYKAKQNNYYRMNWLVQTLSNILESHKELSDNDQLKLSLRFKQYCKFYEQENWRIVAVEQSFTKVLYEDDDYIYVYEGTPDLVVRMMNGDLAIVDHKTRSMDKDLLGMANQPLGYLWACDTQWFIYNYFGLQDTGDPKKWFKRQFERFNKELIDRWVRDTIEVYHAARISAETGVFRRTYNCDSKYGPCQFYKICGEGNDFGETLVIRQHFQIRQDNYGKWS